MTCKKSVAFGVVFGFAAVLSAEAAVTNQYHFIKGCTDWQSADSYTEKTMPPASTAEALTDIIMPAGWTNEVSTTADYEYLSSIRSVQLPKGSGIDCRVDSGTKELACAVYLSYNDDWESGTLIKSGAGQLNLTAQDRAIYHQYGYHGDYYADIHVKGGKLLIYPNETRAADRQLRCVTIDAGATFALGAGNNRWFTRELSGAGTLSGEASSSSTYTITCSHGGGVRTFSGKVTGNLAFSVNGIMNLTGLESDYTGLFSTSLGVSETNYVGIAKFGRKGGPGAVGAQTYYNAGYTTAAARFKYLGTGGDKPNHRTFVLGMGVTPFTLHGGPYGGFDATEWDLPNWSSAHGQYVLEGDDGSAANKFSITCFSAPNVAGSVNTIYKRKGGTWTMAAIAENATSPGNSGFVSIEGGVLEAENVDNVGFASSLGFGLNKNYDWDKSSKTMVEVPYGIRLGGESDSPAVLSVGSKHSVPVLDRPIALRKGESHLRNSTAEQPVMWKGIAAMEAGGSTFYLDGTCMATSSVACVSNGLGVVSVVKDGPGTWCLTGEQTFTGSLEAKAGTLILKKPDYSAYSWYRWVIRAFQGAKKEAQLDQLGLYGSDGKRLGKGAKFNKYLANLQPGECAWGFKYEVEGMYEDVGTATNRGYRADGVFAGSTPLWKDKAQGGKDIYNACQMLMPYAAEVGVKGSWFTVVQRLPAGSAVPAYLDICNAYSGPSSVWQGAYAVKNFALEASVDGFTWDQIYEDTNAPLAPAGAQHSWMSDNAAGWGSCGRNLTSDGAGGFTNGFEIPSAKRTPSGTAPEFLTGITAFKVLAGATVVGEGDFTLPSGIAMTITKNGDSQATINGVKFPENGSLDVVGVSRDATEVPATFTDASYSNIQNWNLTFDGQVSSRKVVARDGKLIIIKRGLVIVFE